MPIAHIWSYEVRPAHVEAFRHGYGPDGEWATFFAQAEGYLGTVLFEQCDAPTRFVTIDYFTDETSRSRLVADRADEYEAIDQKWDATTTDEAFVGVFRVQGGP